MVDSRKKLRSPNFKVRHISVQLDRRELNLPIESGINVLYGRNGVGKTRILDVIPKGSVTLSFEDSSSSSNEGRFPGSQLFNRFLEEPFEAASKYAEDSLLSDGYWYEPLALPLREILGTLRETQERFSFVDDLAIEPAVRARVWGVLLAIVGRIVSVDERLVVDAILEILSSKLISVDRHELTYRVMVSSETPALQTLLERTNRLIQERFNYLEATDWADGGEEWLEILNILLYEGSGGLLQYLIDEPFRSYLLYPLPSVGSSPIGTIALKEPIGSSDQELFEFVGEQLIDYRKVTEDWFLNEAPEVEAFEEFVRKRIDNDEDLESFEDDLTDYGDGDPAARREKLLLWLKNTPKDGLVAFLFGVDGPNPHTDTLAERASALASDLFKQLLDGAPQLAVKGNPARLWESDGLFAWGAIDQSGVRIGLDKLSATQQRWARFAISIALSSPKKLQIVILDEPELGLHRSAEQHLLAGLHQISVERGTIVIVASHSPVFLRPDLCALHHVDRDPDSKLVFIKRMEALQTSRIAELGLVPSDLLQRIRTVLLVEGEHDRWVLEELFADDFSRHGVLLIPLRGAKALKATADARLLFDYTSARVIVTLDNESTERVEMIWNAAVVAREEGSNESTIVGLLKELGDGRTVEGKALQEFCVRAIAAGVAERVGFQMVSKSDIIEYFPPEAFIRKANTSDSPPATWEQLREEHRLWRVGDSANRLDFKSWLSRTYRARFDEQTFRRAVSQQDTIHDDFIAVLSRVVAH